MRQAGKPALRLQAGKPAPRPRLTPRISEAGPMRYSLLLLVAGALSLMALPAAAEKPAGGGKEYRVEVDPGSVFSRMMEKGGQQGRYVSLRFRILRLRDSAVVTSVTKDDIVVEEEGARVAELEIKQPRAAKLTVVLAMDVSFSMERNNKIKEAKEAALTFLNKLDAKADVGLILFDHEIKAAVPPARGAAKQAEHRDRLRELIRAAKPIGGTAYLDATVKAVQMLRGVEGRKAVVLMTDGVD